MEGQRPRVVPIGSAKPRPQQRPPKATVPPSKPQEPAPVPNWAWIFVALMAGFLLGLMMAPHLNR